MPPLNRYLVIIPDFPNVLAKRMEVRDQHIDGVKKNLAGTICHWGGGLSDEHVKEGEPPNLNGSALTICADSKKAVLDIISNDIYAKSGVWDVKNAKIHAFYRAIGP